MNSRSICAMTSSVNASKPPEEDDHPVLIPALRTGRVMGLNRLNVRMFALPPPITHEPWSFTLSGRSGVGSWAVRATWWGVACLGVMFKRQSLATKRWIADR